VTRRELAPCPDTGHSARSGEIFRPEGPSSGHGRLNIAYADDERLYDFLSDLGPLEPDMTQIEGGCLCGAIRFRATETPRSSIICHCRTCRRASAAPSVAWLTLDRGSFELIRGAPRRFASSPGVVRTFCVDCGSPLTYESEVRPHVIDVTTMSLDDESLFPPTQEEWLSHKLVWEATGPSLVQYPEDPTDEPPRHAPG
jgi:hypothetical protein